MKKSLALLSFVLVALTALPASAADLGMGSKAPPLEVNKFVKGEPVKQFEKGKIYVVEFWATWCGPCRESIPHLTELQKKYKDVVVIGVSVFESDQARVTPFVKKMGDQMDYRVAVDAVPAGGEGKAGKMAKGWMEAAGQSGIPTAFVVDGDGVLAWIGHPAGLEKPLAAIVAGKWDVKLAAAREKRREEITAKLESAGDNLNASKAEKLVKYLDEQFTADPELEAEFAPSKFSFLLRMKDSETRAVEYGKRLLNKVLSDDADALTEIAHIILDSDEDPKPGAKLKALALEVAVKANELAEGKSVENLDVLARGYFATGDAKKAVIHLEKAIKVEKASGDADDKLIREMEKRLKEYKAAAEKKD
jgi:thiol-disulfide isomerase/thioredoxin